MHCLETNHQRLLQLSGYYCSNGKNNAGNPEIANGRFTMTLVYSYLKHSQCIWWKMMRQRGSPPSHLSFRDRNWVQFPPQNITVHSVPDKRLVNSHRAVQYYCSCGLNGKLSLSRYGRPAPSSSQEEWYQIIIRLWRTHTTQVFWPHLDF